MKYFHNPQKCRRGVQKAESKSKCNITTKI